MGTRAQQTRRASDKLGVAINSYSQILWTAAGLEADTDDRHFAPPDVVTHATFVVESGRSRHADGAVLDAAASLSLGFAGHQRVAVSSATATTDDPGPFGLIIEVGEREQAEITAVGAGELRITGRSDALVTQARADSTTRCPPWLLSGRSRWNRSIRRLGSPVTNRSK